MTCGGRGSLIAAWPLTLMPEADMVYFLSHSVLLVRVQGQVMYRLQVHRKHAARRDPRAMEPILGPTELWI